MRPFPGDDAFLRPRAADNDGTPTAFNASNAGPQMSYIIADESIVDASLASTSSFHPTTRKAETRKSGGGGGGGPHHAPETPGLDAHDAGPSTNDSSTSYSTLPRHDNEPREEHTPRPHAILEFLENEKDNMLSRSVSNLETPPFRSTPGTNASQPMTPILLGASGPTSVLSSVSSRRNSLTASLSAEDVGSRGPLSVDDGEADGQELLLSSAMMDSGSAPQLIMPSIKMPSRRPFTPEGKSMGRLKVLLAGASGVGKTSLVKAIVQSCDHIVHVDPIGTSQPSLAQQAHQRASSMGRAKGRRPSSSLSSSSKAAEAGTTQITEIYASTKPYPEWWSEMDDLSILRRRKSLGDTVLDRNICFIDTPGYGIGSSSLETITPVVRYVESQFQRMNSNTLTDGEMLKMLGGDGGAQVDLVFYLISNRLKPVDIHYLQKLAALTNIIPVLARTDLMSAEDLASCRRQVESQLQEANIRPFSFGTAASGFAAQSVFATSSATGTDHDTMDASLLMSPDYVQPLMPTELASLVAQVFTQDGASRLRHSAVRKYIQWRRGENPLQEARPYPPRSLSSSYAHSTPSSQVLTPPLGATSSYALARVADHTQREERLAQIRLANWAAELQKSLANERAQYETLARSERAFWLTEKLNECVQDGMLVPVPRAGSGRSRSVDRLRDKIRRKMAQGSGSMMQHQDPLGLLEVAADLQRKSLLALELLGSLGVLGGLALWLSRNYWHLQAYEWAIGEWERIWGGGR